MINTTNISDNNGSDKNVQIEICEKYPCQITSNNFNRAGVDGWKVLWTDITIEYWYCHWYTWKSSNSSIYPCINRFVNQEFQTIRFTVSLKIALSRKAPEVLVKSNMRYTHDRMGIKKTIFILSYSIWVLSMSFPNRHLNPVKTNFTCIHFESVHSYVNGQ